MKSYATQIKAGEREIVSFYVSTAEKEALIEKANREQRTLSNYCRKKISEGSQTA